MESEDPTVVRSLAVHADDVVQALETNARADGEVEAILRVTPPFSGRMRARLHLAGREGESGRPCASASPSTRPRASTPSTCATSVEAGRTKHAGGAVSTMVPLQLGIPGGPELIIIFLVFALLAAPVAVLVLLGGGFLLYRRYNRDEGSSPDPTTPSDESGIAAKSTGASAATDDENGERAADAAESDVGNGTPNGERN